MSRERRLASLWKTTKKALTRGSGRGSAHLDGIDHLEETPCRYRPLKEGEFRFLDILPMLAAEDPTIRCNLRIASFQGATPEYEAISYVWGDPTPNSTIFLDGHKLRLPVNSERALRRMAMQDRIRTVYLDAVCINQTDLEERKTQVMLMGQIYRKAKRTLVYVGDTDETTGQAMQNLGLLAQEMQSDVQQNDADSTFGLARLVVGEEAMSVRSMAAPNTEIDEVALEQFFRRPWFRRVWVVQEVALSPQSLLLCGTFEMDMDTVLDVGKWLSTYHGNYLPPALIECLSGVMSIWDIRDALIRQTGLSLDTILQYGRELKSTDPRDKIFGMLGVIELARFDITIVPDYTLYPSQVFRDAVRESLTKSSWALGASCHENEADLHRVDLPSWVPRLERPWKYGTDSFPLPFHGKAKTSDGVISRPVDHGTQDPDVLLLSGINLGHAVEISNPLDDLTLGDSKNPSPKELEVLLEWCKSSSEFLSGRGVCSGDIGRILISDTNIESQQSTLHDTQALALILDMAPNTRDRTLLSDQENSDKPEAVQATRFISAMIRTCAQRRIAVMADDTVCVVPKLTQPSDVVISLQGGLLPLVLRPHEEGYLVLGECYMDGLMPWQRHGLRVRKRLMTEQAQNFAVR